MRKKKKGKEKYNKKYFLTKHYFHKPVETYMLKTKQNYNEIKINCIYFI